MYVSFHSLSFKFSLKKNQSVKKFDLITCNYDVLMKLFVEKKNNDSILHCIRYVSLKTHFEGGEQIDPCDNRE